MATLKPGDQVWINERQPTPEDGKTGLYFSYFGNLKGTVDRVYEDGLVCVEVEIESLPEGIRARHERTQSASKAKWLDSLSGEALNRLTEEEKQFRLSYKILVSADDLRTSKPSKTAGVKSSSSATAPSAEKSAHKPEELKRLTPADLDRAEEEALKQRMKGKKL